MLRPYKFQVIATCQRLDDSGNVLGEEIVLESGEPVTLYGVAALVAWAQGFTALLEAAAAEQN